MSAHKEMSRVSLLKEKDLYKLYNVHPNSNNTSSREMCGIPLPVAACFQIRANFSLRRQGSGRKKQGNKRAMVKISTTIERGGDHGERLENNEQGKESP